MRQNIHFRASDRMAALLPSIHTYQFKHLQQQAILRELLAGLRTGGR